MKKKNILQFALITSMLTLFLTSCHNDTTEALKSGEYIDSTKKQKNNLNEKWIDGKAYYVGLGFDSDQEEVKTIPFNLNSSTIFTSNPNSGVRTTYQKVTSEEELKRYFSTNITINSSTGIKNIFSADSNFELSIKNQFNFDGKHMNVLVKLEYAMEEKSLPAPFLSNDAKSILDTDPYEFNRRYGDSYVKKNIQGGVAYYWYIYDLTKIENKTEIQVERSISASLGSIFNAQAGVNATIDDHRITSQSSEIVDHYSNAIGFDSKNITDVKTFTEEKTRFREYIINNPDNRGTLSLSTEPYTTILRNYVFATPIINSIVVEGDFKDTISIYGKNFTTNCEVEIRDSQNRLITIYEPSQLEYPNDEKIQFIITNTTALSSFNSKGLRFNVKNIALDKTSTYGNNHITYRSKLIPYVNNTGSGCNDKKCIWITGNSFEKYNSYVVLHDPYNWSVLSVYKWNEIDFKHQGYITLRLKSERDVSLFQRGFRIVVVNEFSGSWSKYHENNITYRW